MADLEGAITYYGKTLELSPRGFFAADYRPAHVNPGAEREPPRGDLPGIRILGMDDRCSEERPCRARDG